MHPSDVDPRNLDDQSSSKPTRSPIFHVVGAITRLVMLIPVFATFFTAVGLALYGAFETYHFLQTLLSAQHGGSRGNVLLVAIEIVDIFLLATVVQVVSLGLYQLYFDKDLRLPKWLTITSLDELKSKLVGVVVTVLAVFFLGQAVVWTGAPDIIYLGGAIGVVIASLTYFLKGIEH